MSLPIFKPGTARWVLPLCHAVPSNFFLFFDWGFFYVTLNTLNFFFSQLDFVNCAKGSTASQLQSNSNFSCKTTATQHAYFKKYVPYCTDEGLISLKLFQLLHNFDNFWQPFQNYFNNSLRAHYQAIQYHATKLPWSKRITSCKYRLAHVDLIENKVKNVLSCERV